MSRSRSKSSNARIPLLTKLVPVETLQDIQDRFSATTGVSAGLRTPPPYGYDLTKPSNRTRFCALIKSKTQGRRLCRECDLYYASVAVKKRDLLCTYRCHAGLVDTAAVICIEGEHIGTIYAGPVLQHLPSAKEIKEILHVAEKLGLDCERLLERMWKLPLVPTEKMQSIAGALQAVARHISQMGYEAYTAHKKSQERLKQIQQMDKIASSTVFEDPIEGLDTLISVAVEVIGRKHSIGILKKDIFTDELILIAGYGPRKVKGMSARAAARQKMIRIPRGKGLTWQAIRRREIIYAPDIRQKKWQRFYYKVDSKTRSEIDIPLILPGDKVIGCINIESPTPKAFDTLDKMILSVLASHVAIVINKADLVENLKSVNLRLAESESRALLAESAIGLAHIIRNPLQIIYGQAELMRHEDRRDRRTRKWAKTILEEVDRINRVIKRQLEYAYEPEFRPRLCTVKNILDRVLKQRSIRRWLHDGKITINRTGRRNDELLHVYVDKTLLHCALTNIIQNATEAMMSHGKNRRRRIIIDTSRRKAVSQVAIGISDTGPGIDRKQFPSAQDVLKPYSSAKFTTPGTNFGLGLAIADRIVRQHNGQIVVSTRKGKGATFTVILPIAL